jgi:hypothetical protein
MSFPPKISKRFIAAGYNSGSFTSLIYLPMTGNELLIGRGREGAMEEGSRPGHGLFNSGQHHGQHGNWHSNTSHQMAVLYRNWEMGLNSITNSQNGT